MPLAGLYFCVGLDFVTPLLYLFKVNIIIINPEVCIYSFQSLFYFILIHIFGYTYIIFLPFVFMPGLYGV
jgi:hypothetical protein